MEENSHLVSTQLFGNPREPVTTRSHVTTDWAGSQNNMVLCPAIFPCGNWAGQGRDRESESVVSCTPW